MKYVLTFALAAFLTACIQISHALAGENCTCRYDGKDVVEGQSICMKTPNGLQMAECSRVLNNTAWKFTGQPCPYSRLEISPAKKQTIG